MKVVALGGSGGMGRHAVRTALADGHVRELIVADLDGDAAARFAAECGGPTRAATVDVRDESALVALLTDADVVLNTVGPFCRFGVSALRAAIRAGCHYLDINDDCEPTLAMLDLDDEARAAGVTVVVGMGSSPGISNLLAVKALDELDHVQEVYVVWDLSGVKPDPTSRRPSAATVHGIRQLTGKIHGFEDGQARDMRPLRKSLLDYPGFGRVPVWSIGHTEALTLPRKYPELRRSETAVMTSRLACAVIRAFGVVVNLRLASIERVATWTERLEAVQQTMDTKRESTQDSDSAGSDKPPPLFVLARGLRGRKPATVAATITSGPPGGMGAVTGIPLAVGLSLLASNEIHRRGVFTPEEAVEPDAFFARFARHCQPAPHPEDIVLVTRSWEDVRLAARYSEIRDNAMPPVRTD